VKSFTSDHKPGELFRVGASTVAYTADAAAGNTATCTFVVTVEDREKPVIGDISVDPPNLWPANHKTVLVTVTYTTSDNCGVASSSSTSRPLSVAKTCVQVSAAMRIPNSDRITVRFMVSIPARRSPRKLSELKVEC
jgi:HYR domain-containing protein